MYDHIGLKVKDIDASVGFYTAALATLGHVLCSHNGSGASFGPPGEAALWLYPAEGSTGLGGAYRIPRPQSGCGRPLPHGGSQGRRARPRATRLTHGVQPQLLRRVSARSGRQQHRSRLYGKCTSNCFPGRSPLSRPISAGVARVRVAASRAISAQRPV
jgi:catechol 2,3-dioxygenase-like lactoylglutathione lyase family enzyme